ncbi:phosphate-binding protein PstS 1 precursor [Clostridium tepidiprofundi DSM 19306]|uniref:Phosphate-binding protein n=1 Tax=Clostridium tepidiprofundi DSM 19306 TaxID=1121338 RepID=A0A151B820_9CLOT|nr:phosphate ABC transporter substrate-binding protein PstS family protein [Clostridium tepidiprofundi]KYH35940.1 phosphate-binding protein PstS 1 precursor [Clostridium tepidiprofundi DSM 19306]
MKFKGLKLMVGVLSISLMTGLFSGCGNTTKSKSNISESPYSGEITALGSSALQPLVEAAAKDFMNKHTEATINVQGGGSGNGIKGVVEGSCEIGDSDIKAEEKLGDSELAKQLVDHKVCGIGFAVVVNNSVTVDSLTKQQIQDIFTGKITNWKQVGGEDMKIQVINRKSSSGTRATFIDTVMDGKREKQGLGTVQPENSGVRDAIKVTKGAISYLALSYITDDIKKDVKIMKINGIGATTENIKSGKYPFWSFEHMYTKGEAKGLTKSFLDFMVSDENKKNIKKLGYIPISELK